FAYEGEGRVDVGEGGGSDGEVIGKGERPEGGKFGKIVEEGVSRVGLRASPWPDLPLAERGTHLGIPIGREVSLEDVWEGPLTKALQKIKNNFSLIRALPFSSRILFIIVFIVSLFSYHGLFFILPNSGK